MNRRIILNCIVILGSLGSLTYSLAGFSQADRYIAGTHYTVLESSVRTADASKIEVLEIFWYGCPGCYSFEPVLNDWAENRKNDIDFVRFPGVFNSLMKIHAQIFYMSKALGITEQTHAKVFDALVPQRRTVRSEQQVVDLFVEFGVDRIEAEKTFNSFAVRTKTNQAEKLTRDYKPPSTPSMVVNGKYLVSLAGVVNSTQEMLRVVDFLAEKERN